MKPIRSSLLALTLVAVLAACGTTSAGGESEQPVAGDVAITAAEITFDPGTVTVTAAGESFTIAFANSDGMPHNIAIYTDDTKADKLFDGEMVTDGSILYTIPALDAGTYFFDCSLHPSMTGTLVVES